MDQAFSFAGYYETQKQNMTLTASSKCIWENEEMLMKILLLLFTKVGLFLPVRMVWLLAPSIKIRITHFSKYDYKSQLYCLEEVGDTRKKN